MIIYERDGSNGFDFWSLDLHPDFRSPGKGTHVPILLAAPVPDKYGASVTCSDVVYGFREGELAFAGEVIGLRTPHSGQALLPGGDGKPDIALAVARVVVMRTDVTILQQPEWRTLAARLVAVHERCRRPDVPIAHAAWRMFRHGCDDPMVETLDATGVPLSPEEHEAFVAAMRRRGHL